MKFPKTLKTAPASAPCTKDLAISSTPPCQEDIADAVPKWKAPCIKSLGTSLLRNPIAVANALFCEDSPLLRTVFAVLAARLVNLVARYIGTDLCRIARTERAIVCAVTEPDLARIEPGRYPTKPAR